MMIANTAKAALIVGTALGLSMSAASAASMAKAGMDKRIADLEREVVLLKNQAKSAMMPKTPAKMIQSGNSRVRLTLYGQVNKAVRVASVDGETQFQTVDNDGSSSRIGIRAVGKANPNLTIGALHELEWQYNRRSGTGEGNDGNERIRARHVDLWLSHKDLGKLSMGKGSIAGDAAHLITLSGVSHIMGFGGPSGSDGGVSGGRNYTFGGFFGARQSRVRYDTPNLMGLSLAASMNEKEGWSVQGQYVGAPPGVKDFNAFIRAGYRQDDGGGNYWGVSGGVAHSSGFNLNGSYASDSDVSTANGDEDRFQWGIEAGWGGKVSDLGKTNIGVGYHYSDDNMVETDYYYVAVNQEIAAAAADVYFGAGSDSGSDADGNDRDSVTVVIAGARIKF